MPNYKTINPGDEPTPTASQDPDELRAAISELESKIVGFQAERQQIRETTPKPQILEALVPSTAPFQAALDELSNLQKALARLERGNNGTTVVKVGAAKSSEKAGGV